MTHRASALISAQEWFSAGERVGYDAERPGINPRSPLRAFIRRAAGTGVTRTFLPGWPDGSYGWAKVEAFLSSRFHFPRIYLDYIGHGDSDKPRDYPYSTFERADLVEALWHAEGIAQTVVVAFDYSCIVSLELLARRIDRERAGNDQRTRITACLLAPFLRPVFSRGYPLSAAEMKELHDAISRRDGVRVLPATAGFVDEHREHAARWDLARIISALGDEVAFGVVGSAEDPFEGEQLRLARERLADSVEITELAGGHLTTAEQPDRLAEVIAALPERS
ncbi:epoxide hydrolase [Mycobacterium tuberculosis]|uniref:alpha/beta fold hydrolase n=1 Tax=Mycobacterium tuberculosis TaxID=1773 RepID=UPI000617A307|nr:alpha/beta hydrolase [Mycobacterium tuberculosis]CRG08904.1 epoxide hydrolase [Mycobacterium tuberculosis]